MFHLFKHQKHKNNKDLRKHNINSSKMCVSIQFSNQQVHSGSHKCVQHISLGYAHKEFYSHYFKRQKFTEYSIITDIFIHQKKKIKT
jgi:hypothetical protein